MIFATDERRIVSGKAFYKVFCGSPLIRVSFVTTGNRAHSERRPKNIYSQEEMNLYCIIKLATEISLFTLQISKT